MYLPLELNTPLLVGGLIAHFVAKSARGDERLGKARGNRGTLIASGFIAGGAVMGVVAAFLKLLQQGFVMPWFGWKMQAGVGVALFNNAEGARGEIIAILAYALLIIYMYWDSKRAKA